MTPAIAVIGERKFHLFQENEVVALPCGGRSTDRSVSNYLPQNRHPLIDAAMDSLAAHSIDLRLPLVVIPCMQPDLMTFFGNRTDERGQAAADDRAWPKGPSKKDVPPVETGRSCANHLQEKRRTDQPPEIPAHVVRTDGKEKGASDSMICQQPAKAGDPHTLFP